MHKSRLINTFNVMLFLRLHPVEGSPNYRFFTTIRHTILKGAVQVKGVISVFNAHEAHRIIKRGHGKTYHV